MALNALSTTSRNGMCDFLVDNIDTGAADAGGDLTIHTAAFGTLLAEPLFANPAFGAAAAGVATANAIADDPSANNTGTAAVIRIQDRANAQVVDGNAGVAAEDLVLNTVSITLGDIVAITSGTITMPAS